MFTQLFVYSAHHLWSARGPANIQDLLHLLGLPGGEDSFFPLFLKEKIKMHE